VVPDTSCFDIIPLALAALARQQSCWQPVLAVGGPFRMPGAKQIRSLKLVGLQVLSAAGVSEHLDFVAQNATYEEQLQSAGKAYLDWYMLSQVRGSGSGSEANGGTPQIADLNLGSESGLPQRRALPSGGERGSGSRRHERPTRGRLSRYPCAEHRSMSRARPNGFVRSLHPLCVKLAPPWYRTARRSTAAIPLQTPLMSWTLLLAVEAWHRGKEGQPPALRVNTDRANLHEASLNSAQMEVLLMSKGGFSISAAHAGRPRRAMYLEGAPGTCVQSLTFHHAPCGMRLCQPW